MKLKFIDQQYQSDAVDSIVNIFEGSEIKDSLFTVDISKSKHYNPYFDEMTGGEGNTFHTGYGNRLDKKADLLKNVQRVQEDNEILKSNDLHNNNFTIEMETGTGKTYVYTKTIFELNKKYGFTKFIIVVPSIAIKEGVYKSFQITDEHFRLKYDNTVYNYFVYDSSDVTRIQSFATNTSIEVMIINIDAFRKSFTDPSKETKANIIHRVSEKLSGNKPIDLIASTNPIVIIDEPQSVDSTKKSKEAIKSLNPLCTLRYSATHKEMYNLMYRLTPVDAYQENLVKHIEVASVLSDESSAKAYVKLISINLNNFTASLEIYVKNKKDGTISKKKVTARTGDDLLTLSGGVDYYGESDYTLDDLGEFDGDQYVYFTNGKEIFKGEAIGEVSKDAVKRAQIRETIDLHLKKEESYLSKGIKVLSLFFIDKVANYKTTVEGKPDGKYAQWFEEEFNTLVNTKYRRLKDKYKDKITFDASEIHDGYFSGDKKGNTKDTKGDTNADISTYEKIMRAKERLLSMEEPLRFIFSHSTLKEGWDNPNVFQVCTLVETKDTMTKRQKIGRGLRICVNQDGERVSDPKYNVLSVVANESYKDFASSLQRELEKEAGYKFGVVEDVSFSNLEVKTLYGQELKLSQEDSVKIHKNLMDNNYLKKNGKVEEKFFVDVKEGTFIIPEEYKVFTEKVITTIKKLSRELPIKDARKKVSIKINKEVFVSDTFKNLWKKIRQKTFYSIELNVERLKIDAIDKVKSMDKIKPERIERERTKMDITDKGIIQEGNTRYGKIADIKEYDEIIYPDFIRRLQDATGFMRKTIIDIIRESGRLPEFYINPETFIKQVSNILLAIKKTNLETGLKYHKDDEYYVVEDVFNDENFEGYLGKDTISLSENKNIFDHVKFDSKIEKLFAEDAEVDEDVILYAKLPALFKIDTPFGYYNPDWVVVIQSNEGDKLYFVAETKGSKQEDQRRIKENSKILAGRKHFEVIDEELRYEVVTSLKELK